MDNSNTKSNLVAVIETNLDTNETVLKKSIDQEPKLNEAIEKVRNEIREFEKNTKKILDNNVIDIDVDNIVNQSLEENNADNNQDEDNNKDKDDNDNLIVPAPEINVKSAVTSVAKKYSEELAENDSVFHAVKDNFRGMDIDLSNIMLYLTRTIEVVEVLLIGDGEDKKNIVVKTILDLVEDNINIKDDEKEFINFMLESLIETILKTSKKEISLTAKLNKKKKRKLNTNLSVGQIVESLIDKCNTIIRTNQYNAENVIVNLPIIIGMVMSLVESYKELTGAEKKNVVIKVMNTLIKVKIPKIIELKESDTKKLNLVLQIMPTIIDILIEVANGKYNINKLVSCLKRLFCCKGKKKKTRVKK